MSTPIADQIAEIGREIRQRERLYPKWIEAGRLKPETAATKITALRDVETLLRFVEKNAPALRLLCETLRVFDGYEPDALPASTYEDLIQHASVRAVMVAFPNAVITDVRAMPTQGDLSADHETEACDA